MGLFQAAIDWLKNSAAEEIESRIDTEAEREEIRLYFSSLMDMLDERVDLPGYDPATKKGIVMLFNWGLDSAAERLDDGETE